MRREKLLPFGPPLFLLAAALISARPAEETLNLTIAAPDSPVHESNVALEVTMTNRTSLPMTLFKTNPGCDFTAEVKDTDGRTVPLSQTGAELSRCQQRLIVGRRILVTLKPGESTEESYPIDLYYSLPRAGTFTVQLTREVPAQPKLVARSNEIVLNLAR